MGAAVAKKTQLALPEQAAESLASPPLPPEEREEGARPAENGREPSPGQEPPPATLPPLGLEERVRRLEDILAGMHPTAIREAPPPPATEAAGAAAADLPPASSDGVQLPPPASTPWLSPGMFPSHRWLPFEMMAEFRAMVRMYLDPRYRLTWQTRLVPPLILFGMFLSWWMFTAIPLGFLFDRVVFLVLAYALFKLLTREATRYRMTSPDLPPSMRL